MVKAKTFKLGNQAYSNENVDHRQYHCDASNGRKLVPGLFVVGGLAGPDGAHCHAPDDVKNYQTDVYK